KSLQCACQQIAKRLRDDTARPWIITVARGFPIVGSRFINDRIGHRLDVVRSEVLHSVGGCFPGKRGLGVIRQGSCTVSVALRGNSTEAQAMRESPPGHWRGSKAVRELHIHLIRYPVFPDDEWVDEYWRGLRELSGRLCKIAANSESRQDSGAHVPGVVIVHHHVGCGIRSIRPRSQVSRLVTVDIDRGEPHLQ